MVLIEDEGKYWVVGIGAVLIVMLVFGLLALGVIKIDLPPSPANNVEVVWGGNHILVMWDESDSLDVKGYNVYRSRTAGEQGELLNSELITKTFWQDYELYEGGNYYYVVKAVDEIQEDMSFNQLNYHLDKIAPKSLKLKINDGDSYTSNKIVSLTLGANAADECKLQNEGEKWTEWFEYTSTINWTLSNADGLKIINLICRDYAYNEALPISSYITLDQTAPLITIISPVEQTINSELFELTFEVTDGSGDSECQILIDNIIIETIKGKGIFKNNYSVGYHQHNLRIECVDVAGNKQIIENKFSISYDPEAIRYECILNNGSTTTYTRDITIEIFADLAQNCKLNNYLGETINYTNFNNIEWQLTEGYGLKTVYVECFNDNNISLGNLNKNVHYLAPIDPSTNSGDEPTNDDYSTTPKNVWISIEDGERYFNSRHVVLDISARYASSCRLKNENEANYCDWFTYTERKSWELSFGDGIKTVSLQCKNNIGDSKIEDDTITIDTIPPNIATRLNAEGLEGGQILLTWDSPSDSDINNYDIYRRVAMIGLAAQSGGTGPHAYADYQFVDTSSSTNWIDGDTSSGVTYEYKIKTVDKAGNKAELSNSVSAMADSEAPEIILYSPSNGAHYNSNPIPLSFAVYDDITTMVFCYKKVDGDLTSLGYLQSGQTHIFHFDVSGNGNYNIEIICEDEVNNEESESSRFSFGYEDDEDDEEDDNEESGGHTPDY